MTDAANNTTTATVATADANNYTLTMYLGTSVTDDVSTLTNNEKLILVYNTEEEALKNETIKVTDVDSIADIDVENGTDKDEIGLPETVDVTLSDSTTTSASVTWDNGDPEYNGDVAGTYTFTGILTLPDRVTNLEEKKASVDVIVKSSQNETTSLAILDDIYVENGTDKDEIGLPEIVDVTLSDSTTTSAAVTWDDGRPEYNGDVAGTYTFTGILTLPDGVANPDDYTASVDVIVKSSQNETTSLAVTLVDSIDGINVENGTDKDEIGLPETVDVTLSDSTTSAAVTWNNGSPEYKGDVAGTYTFTGILTLPDGVANPDDYTASVDVIVRKYHRTSSSSSRSSSSSNNGSTTTTTTTTAPSTPGTTATVSTNADGTIIKLVNSNGQPATGWQQINGAWYLADVNGTAKTGWQLVNGKWYLMAPTGVMQAGWQQESGKWYLLNTDGAMATGWQKSNGAWYLLKDNGAMSTGWQESNGKWYYLYTNGEMASNITIDGYTLGNYGDWIQ